VTGSRNTTAYFIQSFLGRVLRRPQREQQQEQRHHDGEGADQDVVGLGFHLSFPGCAAACHLCGAGARTVEIVLHPRVIVAFHFLDRRARTTLRSAQHRDAVADGVQRVEVVVMRKTVSPAPAAA
jgi:hypothetical protein